MEVHILPTDETSILREVTILPKERAVPILPTYETSVIRESSI